MDTMRTLRLRAGLALPLLLVAALAACDDDPNPNHRAAILDVATGDWRYISDADEFANSVAWAPDSQSVVVMEGNDAVSRDATSGSQRWRVESDEGSPVREAAYSPGGETVAVLRLHEALGGEAGTSVELVSRRMAARSTHRTRGPSAAKPARSRQSSTTSPGPRTAVLRSLACVAPSQTFTC